MIAGLYGCGPRGTRTHNLRIKRAIRPAAGSCRRSGIPLCRRLIRSKSRSKTLVRPDVPGQIPATHFGRLTVGCPRSRQSEQPDHAASHTSGRHLMPSRCYRCVGAGAAANGC